MGINYSPYQGGEKPCDFEKFIMVVEFDGVNLDEVWFTLSAIE